MFLEYGFDILEFVELFDTGAKGFSLEERLRRQAVVRCLVNNMHRDNAALRLHLIRQASLPPSPQGEGFRFNQIPSP